MIGSSVIQRPGNYYALALEGSFNSGEMQDPEYARLYLDAAKSVRLERGSTATLTLGYENDSPAVESSRVRKPVIGA